MDGIVASANVQREETREVRGSKGWLEGGGGDGGEARMNNVCIFSDRGYDQR